ncbi:hypothetical protein ABIF68_003336 [Bradyrhizobium japonicum]
MTRWKPLWTLIPGSRLDADHPENGVLIPCRNTTSFLGVLQDWKVIVALGTFILIGLALWIWMEKK